MSNRVTGILGICNGGPLSPFVQIEGDFDWLTPNQARSLAKRLTRAAANAEVKAINQKAAAKLLARTENK